MRLSNGDWDYSKYIKTSERMQLPPKAQKYFKTLEHSIEDSKGVIN